MKKTVVDTRGKDAAIFIMPRSSKAWLGAEALWITAAGWASAAKRSLGHAWVVTQDRIAQPEAVIDYPLVTRGKATSDTKGKVPWMPLFVKTIIKDLRLLKQSFQWRILEQPSPWDQHNVAFVWQQHDLFANAGIKLAKRLKVPLVMYVHAPVVWETAKWGVKRYAWGWFLERFVEARALRAADVVACVSQEVEQQLQMMGVPREKIVVSPMAADPFLFNTGVAVELLRKKLALENTRTIGWVGSFRSFHGIDLLLRAFASVVAQHRDVKLLLVGDGQERFSTEKLANDLQIASSVIFAGRQPFSMIPQYISLFDIAIVSARSSEGFHYSPLKLREYLAAGKATLAPRAGEIPHAFVDRLHILTYEAGNVQDLADKMTTLLQDKALVDTLTVRGKEHVLKTGTWDNELRRISSIER